MALVRHVPGRKFVLFLIRALRFILALYIAGLSIATIVVSAMTGHVGGIIASIYLIPTSFFLIVLELGYLSARGLRPQEEMRPLQIVALQFLGATTVGVTWPNNELFIVACVGFGLGIALMNLAGIYYLFWSGGADSEEPETSDAWSHDYEKLPRGTILMPGEEDMLLFQREDDGQGVEQGESCVESAVGDGPETLSLD